MSDNECQEVPSHQHFSERLGRNWQDGDLLYLDEVAKVLTANSGRDIPVKYVTDLIVKHMLPASGPPRQRLIQYSDVRLRRVMSQPGKRRHAEPSPTAQRQRKFKERRKQQQQGQLGEPGDQGLQRVG